MNDSSINVLKTYFRQQSELNYPDYIFTTPGFAKNLEHDNITKNIDKENFIKEHAKPAEPHVNKRAALVELYKEVKDCTGCTLSNQRTKLVFGAGNANAKLMIIGEAPGFEEDRQGLPFVGKAGELLTKMLSAINIDRDKGTFITNILKCRPPENRNPNQSETIGCVPILNRQINIISPIAILALGRIAANEILSKSDSVNRLRNDIHVYNKIPVIVTYHPAALLRYEQYKRPAWEDLQKLQNILKEKGYYNGN